MEPIWDLHLPKDDICVAKYDFDGLDLRFMGGLGWADWTGNEVDKPVDST